MLKQIASIIRKEFFSYIQSRPAQALGRVTAQWLKAFQLIQRRMKYLLLRYKQNHGYFFENNRQNGFINMNLLETWGSEYTAVYL